MLNFSAFYRANGVRTLAAFRSPVPRAVVELSKNSILHLPAEQGQDFPDESSVFLRKMPNKICLYNEFTLLDQNHSTGYTKFDKRDLVRQWVAKHRDRFMSTIKPITAINEETQLAVVSYGLADNGYRYAEANKLTPYNRWSDTYHTLWQRVSELSTSSDRQNYILIPVEGLPASKTALIQAVKTFGVTQASFFDTTLKRVCLDIFLWLDRNTRHRSAMGRVPFEGLHNTNLLFQLKDGRSVVLNLGYLDRWVEQLPADAKVPPKTAEDLKKAKEIEKYLLSTGYMETRALPPERIRLDFLSFMLALNNFNLQGEASAREGETEQEADRQDISGDNEAQADDERKANDAETYQTSLAEKAQPLQNGNSAPGKVTDLATDIGNFVYKDNDKVAKVSKVKEEDEGSDEDVDAELEILDRLEQRRVRALNSEGVEVYDPSEGASISELKALIEEPPKPGDIAIRQLNTLLEKGSISGAEFRKKMKLLEEFMKLPDPFTGKGNIIEAATYKPEDLVFNEKRMEIVDPLGIAPPSLLKSTIEELDRRYIERLFRVEILASILSVMNLGILIDGLEISEIETAEGKFMEVSMVLHPIGGKPSPVRHRFPIPDIDGTFRAKGVRYHLRKQVNDDNERKIRGDEVGITSYTSKLFLNRVRSKAHNATAFLVKHLNKAQMGDIPDITRVRTADVYDNNFECPYIYSTLSQHYKGFAIKHKMFGEMVFDFDHRDRDNIIDKNTRTSVEKNGNILCGRTKEGKPIYVTKNDEFMVLTDNGEVSLGNIHALIGSDESKSPVEYAEMGVLDKTVPVGIVLGRQLGFRNLLKYSGVKYRMEEGRSVAIEPHEFKVRFKDRTFVFSKNDRLSMLIFGGFSKLLKDVKDYPASSFDSPGAYDLVLEEQDFSSMHLRELDNLNNGYLDPISLRRMKSKGSPLTFTGLLLKACQDLTKNQSPDTSDTDYRQILGYERFAGAVHRRVYRAARAFRNRNATGRGRVNMSYYDVWQDIMEDSAIKTCEDINPIQNIKMRESLTFGGEGGRGRETFNVAARAMHTKDAGIISEASVDSGDVGFNISSSSNPALSDLNGKRNPNEKLGYGNMLSTSLNMVASPNRNDMKRNVFVSIQNAHTIACNGYEQSRIQTGAESLVGQRTDSLFCKTAEDEGKVVSITERGIVVQYKDGTRQGVILGRRYGDAEGTTYPHDIVTDLKVGDRVNKGETIAYNKAFFEPSYFNPKFSVMKFSLMGNVAFIEAPETHEDSASINEDIAKLMQAETTDPRSYVLRFGQNVHEVLKPGSVVDPDTVLMVIEDEITSGTNIYDARSASTLDRLGRNAPRAGHTGILDSIDCHYHGDKADLSPTLRKLVDASDRHRVDTAKSTETTPIKGNVSSDWSVKGKPLQYQTLEITFNISKIDGMANSDKLVVAEQLKGTVGKVEMRKITTESGRPVPVIFSGVSVIKRIVTVPVHNGSTIAIIDADLQTALNAYFG